MSRANYSDKDIIEAVAMATSIADVCRIIGIKPVGGNYKTVKAHIVRLDLDTSHHLGQAWSRDQRLVQHSTRRSTLKNLVADLKGYECELCGIDSWQGKPLTLELDHVDGNNVNNEMNNLRLLCPNCHSQTDTFRNKKRTLSESSNLSEST